MLEYNSNVVLLYSVMAKIVASIQDRLGERVSVRVPGVQGQLAKVCFNVGM